MQIPSTKEILNNLIVPLAPSLTKFDRIFHHCGAIAYDDIYQLRIEQKTEELNGGKHDRLHPY